MERGIRNLAGADAAERRRWVLAQAASGRLAPESLAAARQLLGLTPSAPAWTGVIAGAFLAAGLSLLAAALVFAVAFNWDALGHYSRFALVQVAILLFGGVAWWRGVSDIAGEASLFAACLAAGALLALFGQTYQTGADPYSLFVVWAALILPWTLHGCRAALWLLWIAVANTGLGLYCGQVLGESGWVRLFGHLEWSAALAIVLNGSLFALFETFPRLGGAGLARAVPRSLAVIALAAVAAVLIPLIGWGGRPLESALHAAGLVVIALGAFAAIAWWSLLRIRDIPVLAAAALCAVSIGFAMVLRVLPHSDAFGLFLFSAVYWIGAITAAVLWLRDLAPAAPAQPASGGPA
jgi:hypothetical protein